MSARTDLQATVRAAAIEAATAWGEAITYTNRDGSAVSGLYAIPGPESKELGDELGITTEETARTFMIPGGQTNFPPTNGVNIDDFVTWDSKKWEVKRYSMDSISANHKVDTVHTRGAKIVNNKS